MSETVTHWLGAIGFVACVLVTLAFLSSYIFLILAVNEIWTKICGKDEDKEYKKTE